ncbi:nuclear transport factor 2 family protein [Chitinophaga silvisoli]|uniref:SnoaL-like domain-containing protein n=1 Tax=Chitinophaga silvisoli TaxID=2291814 RepID=A0A3E1NV61_9BACT|nr:nuclear transport factor 2 family protein [Chitinophaga silvisoli]RFM31842.1 hypothetical protein DXN04_27160 [Chitinophaga silvisoli]
MKTDIIHQIRELFAGADERDWQKVAVTMSDRVLLDYSSMNGNPGAVLTPLQITDMWSGFLPGFDKTIHRLSGFVVDENGDTCTAHFKGVAEHWIGTACWVVEGTYDVTLKLAAYKWLITDLTFHFEQQSGDTNLPVLALERLKA